LSIFKGVLGRLNFSLVERNFIMEIAHREFISEHLMPASCTAARLPRREMHQLLELPGGIPESHYSCADDKPTIVKEKRRVSRSYIRA
jgi:hypothetical protein